MSTGLSTEIRTQSSETVDVTRQVQERFDLADKLEGAVQDLTNLLDEANISLGEKDVELRALRPLADKQDALRSKEQELNAREAMLNQRQEINDLKVSHQESRVKDHKEMVELIFRNTILREQATRGIAVKNADIQTGFYSNDGHPIYQGGGESVESHVDTSERSES